MYFRSKKKSASDISISEPIDTDRDGNTLTLIDVIACESNIVDDIDLSIKIDQLRSFMQYLDKREREIIVLRYGLTGNKPLTQREVAQKMRISRSYVSRIEKRALANLRSHFDKDDSL